MREGSILKEGETEEVTRFYLDSTNRLYSPVTWTDLSLIENSEVELERVSVQQRGTETSVIDCREPFTVQFEYENKRVVAGSRFFIMIRNARGDIVLSTSDYDVLTEAATNRRVGKFRTEVQFPAGLFKSGSYYGTIGADIKNGPVIFAENDVLGFDVFESADDTAAERHRRIGIIAPLLEWHISEPDSKTQS